jgi:hypothetical protein
VIPRISLRQALADPALLGGVLEGESWKPWRTLLLAAMGEELTEDERPVFKKFTGREREPGRRVEEFVGVKGRRAGGSYAGGKVVIPYLAGLCQHPSLVRGERGVLLCVAADQRQADVILDYADASFRASPVLSQLIEGRTQRELRLNNGIDIEVRAADYRRLRGLTFIAVIADEVAFWSSDFSANPDDEILNAVRPGLATTGGPLLMISSPYARRGELWRVFQRHYGAAGDPQIMVAKGSSREFNATLLQSVVDRAYERDPAAASAEYGAEFRRDIESFVAIEAVTACVSRGVYERAPQRGVVYSAFVDPSGGSADAMTLAIGHRDHARQVVVIDALREVAPPFSPEKAVEQFASLLRTYNCFKVVGDRFAGDWPVEVFGKFGVQYEQSAAPKSDLYRDDPIRVSHLAEQHRDTITKVPNTFEERGVLRDGARGRVPTRMVDSMQHDQHHAQLRARDYERPSRIITHGKGIAPFSLRRPGPRVLDSGDDGGRARATARDREAAYAA